MPCLMTCALNVAHGSRKCKHFPPRGGTLLIHRVAEAETDTRTRRWK